MTTEGPGRRIVEKTARPKPTYSPPDRDQARIHAEESQRTFLEELKRKLGAQRARVVHDAIMDANAAGRFKLPSPTERPEEAEESGRQIRALKKRKQSARDAEMQRLVVEWANVAKERGLV